MRRNLALPFHFNNMIYALNLVKDFFIRKPDKYEKKKIIIDTTLHRALLRGSIHLLPISISILLIWMNLNHLYIGPNLNVLSWTTTNSLAAFQLAAKIQVHRTHKIVKYKGLMTLTGAPSNSQPDHCSFRSHSLSASLWRRVTIKPTGLRLHLLDFSVHLLKVNLDLVLG